MNRERLYRWRRLPDAGIEVMRLDTTHEHVRARGEVIDAGERPFALTYDWLLDPAWRTRRVNISLRDADTRNLVIERMDASRWRVDGHERPDLAGCDEIDLSATPFCNTLALRRFGPPPGAAGEMTALYVGFPALELSPSRQRYEQIARREFVYVDLGVYAGYRARITVDEDGLIESYEGLFERILGN
jgi:hypothetical protein